jgi:hypothetical protein
MGVSKIKGHRIADKAIENKHLHDNFKLPEDRLILNYPTHSNAGDLTEAEKNILTQRGNADSLHYHTGGGGGPNGIYTNEERDVQLLKLSMLINSTKYGMDKSVKDLFDDDASIYYGIRAAKAPTLVNITDDPAIGGLLLPNTSYTYGIVYKTIYGETDLINTSVITTGAGAYNSVELAYEDAPAENTGAKIFRSIGNVPKMIVENENVSEWENPYNFDTSIDSTDKTSGLGCYRVSVKGFNSGGNPIYNVTNIAFGIGKRALNDGQQFNSVVGINAPFEYLIQINNKAVVNKMDIVWDSNPANIPIDYEVYYTTDLLPTDITKITWHKFERLSKLKNTYNIPLSVSTDGVINNDCMIVGNTRSLNSFSFKSVRNITGIRIVVKTLMSKCMLTDLRLFTEFNATNTNINKDFGGPQDFREFKTLCVDMKSNLAHKDNLRMGFLASTEVVSSVVNEWSVSPNTTEQLTGKIIRQSIRLSSRNRNTYDRIRISFRPEPNQYIRIENIYVMLDTRNIDNNTGLADCNVETIIVPVTFDNGLPYFDGTPTGDITSDWVFIKFPNLSFYTYKVTFKVVSGSLRKVNHAQAEVFLADAALYSGYESSLIWNGYVSYTASWDQAYVSKIEIGKSNAQYLDLDYFDPSVSEKWHRHYIPMPTGTGAQDIRKLVLYFNNILNDQDVFLDNIKLTRSNNLIPSATMTSSSGCLNEDKVKENSNTYFYSDLTPTNAVPKSIVASFDTAQNINKLLILFGERNSAGKNYSLQYTVDGSASANDPYDSPKWLPMTSIIIGEDGIPQEFKGRIVDNTIYDNNIWANHITHKFAPITCLKVRVIVYATIGDQPLRIMNMKVMTADDTGEMHLIHDRNTPVTVGQKFIDDGKPTLPDIPSLFNTTGSYNVIYDSALRIVKLIDPSKNGVLHLKEIDFGELFMSLILTSQYSGECDFYISNNHGGSYVKVDLDKVYKFTTQSQHLRIKIEFKSPDAMVSAIALLYTL